MTRLRPSRPRLARLLYALQQHRTALPRRTQPVEIFFVRNPTPTRMPSHPIPNPTLIPMPILTPSSHPPPAPPHPIPITTPVLKARVALVSLDSAHSYYEVGVTAALVDGRAPTLNLYSPFFCEIESAQGAGRGVAWELAIVALCSSLVLLFALARLILLQRRGAEQRTARCCFWGKDSSLAPPFLTSEAPQKITD